MTPAQPLEDLAECALLEEFDRLHATQRRAEARVLLAAVEWAHQHGPDCVDPEMAKLPGRQRSIRPGGEGTPKVAEFAAATMGARLELSPYGAQRLLADALDLRYRLPRLWARVQSLEVRAGHARLVARRTRELTPEQAAIVDARAAEYADGRLAWSRFEALVEAAVIAADEAAARAREEEAATQRFAKATRSEENGMRGFYIRADFATIARLDATVAYLAEALAGLGHPGDLDERRVCAVLFMANPVEAVKLLRAYQAWQQNAPADPAPQPRRPEPFHPAQAADFDLSDERLLPMLQLFVHVFAGSDDSSGEPTGSVARTEGHGPVTRAWIGKHLGPRCSFRITPVLDPLGQVPVDAYEIPVRHRNAVRILTPGDTFPYAANADPGSMQIDHTDPYDARPGAPPGQSRIGNYGPMTTFHHRLKTHGNWTVKQPFPGIYLWRDGHGATYLVDHTGTRRTNPARTPVPTRSRLETYLSDVILAA